MNFNYFLKYRDSVANALAARFELTLRTQAHLNLEPRKVGCQTLVYHLDSINRLHGTRIDLDFDESRSVQGRKRVIDLDTELLSGPSFAGDCDPFSALMNSARTDLQLFRDDQWFGEFEQLGRPEQWQAHSPEEAAQLGRHLISTCSRVQSID